MLDPLSGLSKSHIRRELLRFAIRVAATEPAADGCLVLGPEATEGLQEWAKAYLRCCETTFMASERMALQGLSEEDREVGVIEGRGE